MEKTAARLIATLIPALGFLWAAPTASADGPWKQISAGHQHTCAVTSSGDLHCWGQNVSGQLGTGNTTSSMIPQHVEGLSDVKAVSAGWEHTCAVTNDRRAYCWGGYSMGKLGYEGPSDVYGAKRTTPKQVPVRGAESISAGRYHTCASLYSGQVACWGNNSSGQLGRPVGGFVNPPSSAGFARTTTDSNKPVVVKRLANVSSIHAGERHTCALTRDGSVWCWGDVQVGSAGNRGATGRGSNEGSEAPVEVRGLDGVTSLTAGLAHTCAIAGEKGYCWGYNSNGKNRLGSGNTTADVINTPVQVRITDDLRSISAGSQHTCVVTRGAKGICWGENNDGRLGSGSFAHASKPVEVRLPAGVAAISAGAAHTCAVSKNGEAHCWGNNTYGRLGDGTTTSTGEPVPVPLQPPALTNPAVRSR